jgi:membrane protease YdiL (CAAX protease family)
MKRSKTLMSGVKVTLTLLLLLAPALAFAQGEKFENPLGNDDLKISDVIITATQWLLGLVGALFALAIVWGGIQYIISFGDEKRVAKGKTILFYAIFGFVIVLLTLTILATVQQFLGIK